MTKPLLTIAMSCYDDAYGVHATVTDLRLHHDLADTEIVVLDNNPDSVHGKETMHFIRSLGRATETKDSQGKLLFLQVATSRCPISYHPRTDVAGTSATRQELFNLAQGDCVMVTDCHCFFPPGAIAKLKAFWSDAGDEMRKNLFTGPLMYDNMDQVSTHFECGVWRSEMQGVWSTAWEDPNGNLLVSDHKDNELYMKPLMSDGPWMRSGIPWPGHDKVLVEKGFTVAGERDGKPFEVPGQGLGMFISAKEHWVGFHPDFRDFGGEECYVHEATRQRGYKTLCLPFMKWVHRWLRPEGPKYPISSHGKLRNYIIGHKHLGLDLEPVRKHFVDETGVKQELFDLIVSDPVNFDPKNNKFYRQHPNTNLQNMQPVAKSNFGMDLPVVADNLHTIAMHMAGIPRDLDKHAQVLMELASKCSSVAEITHRRESTAFLLAGLTRKQACGKEECKQTKKCENTCKGPVRMVSWQSERDTLIPMLLEAVKTSPGKPVTYTDHKISYEDAIPDIQEQFDLLYLDAQTNETLAPKLEKYKDVATKFLVVHDVHGNLANDKWLGMGKMAKAFLKTNPAWFLYYFEPTNYGIVVFSKDPDLKPAEPLAPWPKTLADGVTPCGVGQTFKRYLKRLGWEVTPNCGCNAKALAMDKMGPQGCRENMGMILDGIYEEAVARKKGYLFNRLIVQKAIEMAIRSHEKECKSGLCA